MDGMGYFLALPNDNPVKSVQFEAGSFAAKIAETPDLSPS